ncbi:Choline/ethanolaminephosphotransferase [Clavulina sp. PMI_390]|nr:Choline/ethanolaminephosphotransferase [Clavulina sp. PMI_390]
MSKLILSAYWTKFASFFPRNVAPNTITLSGLGFVVFNFLTLLYYDYSYKGETGGASGPPQWVYFTWGIGLFLYQTFDACDGKQARKTGMAGPLGEMFDHGCDALNTTLEVILTLRALDLTRSWWGIASIVATAGSFYLTTWEEFHTGTLYLGVFSGPVEGILIVCCIYFITGIFGPSVWNLPLLSLPVLSTITSMEPLENLIPLSMHYLPMNIAFMIFGAFGLAFNIITAYGNVVTTLKKGQSVLLPLLRLMPFCVSVALHVAFASSPLAGKPKKDLVHSPLVLPYMCFWGLEFAHQVGRMITAHVTKTPFPYWDPMWVWIAIGALDGHARAIFGRAPLIQATPLGQNTFVMLSLAISLYSYGRFCYLVIKDITEYLGIACFTVRKKDSRGVWRNVWEIEAEKNQ